MKKKIFVRGLTALIVIAAVAAAASAQTAAARPDYEQLLADAVAKGQRDGSLDETRLAYDAVTRGGSVTSPEKIAADLKSCFPAIDAKAAVLLPPEITANVIRSGPKYERLVSATSRLLNATRLRGKVHPILYDSAVPASGFSYPNALFFSTRALASLSDDEIEAISAQAVAHLVGRELFKSAVDSRDDRSLRVIELFCDAAGASLLASMGKEPGGVVSAIQAELRVYEKSYGNATPPERYPDIRQRAKLVKMLAKKPGEMLAQSS